MKEYKIAAVVVTYNRLRLLKECLKRVLAQTVGCDVLIINNASTDRTEEWLRANDSERVFFRCSSHNLGGAGGFNAGLRWAVEAGYEYIWLMDDDCFPQNDALEKLVEAACALDGDFGWISSTALWIDGSPCRMNRQKPYAHFCGKSGKIGLRRAEQATFVSLFIKTDTVAEYGLPISDFFIWGDDIEYTRRIAVRGKLPGYVADESTVIHAMSSNAGSDISKAPAGQLHRYVYAFRNEAYLYRQEGFAGILYYAAKCIWNFIKILLFANDSKRKRILVLAEGIRKGFAFDPPAENLGSTDETVF